MTTQEPTVHDTSALRILLLSQYYWPEVGAAQTRLSAVVAELVDAGHEVRVVTAMPNYPNGFIASAYHGKLAATEVVGGAKVYRTWVYASMGTGFKRLLNYASFTVSCVLGLARAGKVDLVVIESPPLFLAVPGLLFCRLRRIPSVLNIADLWPDAAIAVGAISDGTVVRVVRRMESWAYRRATIISTVTEGLVERLERKGVPPHKIILLPNGVDTEQFEPNRSDDNSILAELADNSFLIYAGTMGLAHGLDPLIDAMQILSTDPSVPILLMLGSGSEKARLQSRCETLGLDSVLFRDPIPSDELAQLLPRALAGVVTAAPFTLNDSTKPAKLLPLMASGLPILHAGPGHGREIVQEARAGVAVDNNPDAIADGIRQLTASERRRR